MTSFLENYGAGDEVRERRWKRLLMALGALLVLAFFGYFAFRDFPEKRQAEAFLNLVRGRQFEVAYQTWGCTDAHPCRDYSYESFLEDWGPAKNPEGLKVRPVVHDTGPKIRRVLLGAASRLSQLVNSMPVQHCANGIIVTVEFAPGDQVPLWVNRGDLALSIAPWPKCDFRFRAP